jgi:DNA-binding MarR family transcriptional regulator
VKRRAKPGPVGAAENLLGLVHVLSSLIGRAFYGEIAVRHRISLPEWRVLITLANRPGTSGAEIVERWAMQPMMASRAIRQLKRRGWIERKVKVQDRRSYALWLTERGRAALRRAGPHAGRRYQQLVGTLSGRELAALQRALLKLTLRAKQLARGRGR